jgi:hypothetical protein
MGALIGFTDIINLHVIGASASPNRSDPAEEVRLRPGS